MTYDRNNVFARILRGEIPCDKVYEDEHVLAFRDISPQAPTRQVWISAQSTSFKLDWSGSSFVLKSTSETLNQLVGRLVGEQLGVAAVTL